MNKWLHVIGVCGVTTSGMAVAFKMNGWKVTGSDKGFFPPVSEFLKVHGIQILPGFKKERLSLLDKHPDLVIYQGTKGKSNEELIQAQSLQLKIMSYPEALEKYLINQNNSIVVCGSYGKTTTTALLVNIFSKTNYKINYMYGGLNTDFRPNVSFSEVCDYSIVEGDEYITSYQDIRSKFFHYHPKYVILTGISWDHADIFKSEDSYIDNFIKFIEMIPDDGLLIYNDDDPNSIKVSKHAKCRTVSYTINSNNILNKPDWEIVYDSKPLPCLIKNVKAKQDLNIIPFSRNILGKINDLNILASTVLSSELGLKNTVIQEGISTFSGIKRRMEVRFKNDNVIIIDDFGSTPTKLRTSLNTIKEDFPDFNNVVIFEPSAGSRVIESLNSYENCITNCSLVILPKFTILPKNKNVKRFSEYELSEKLMSYGVNNKMILDDTLLISFLIDYIKVHDHVLLLFMGSHSFRKIIENLIIEVKKCKK